MKIWFLGFLLFCLVGCKSDSKLLIEKEWKLEKIYFHSYNQWGKIKNCNRYKLLFHRDGSLDFDTDFCPYDVPSDVIYEEKWKFEDNDLYISAFGKCKVIELTNETLVLKEIEKDTRRATYYFRVSKR